MNRLKNASIFMILISFLCLVANLPVTCIFKSVTGISCPACGMTRAFLAIFRFDFWAATWQNLFSIPLFVFLAFSIVMMIKDFIQNRFYYLPNVIKFLGKYPLFFLILIGISFLFNNLK
ncbi:MAG: DUF2752 domain-containing protein [Clostridia bacterium]|nr:DUF2752 domain-containing protein [Clostridia bacterium]